MKVCGFSFVRNAIEFDYPVVESIKSVLPLCDLFIISVGNSKDDTLQLIQSIDSPKIKIIESVWDDSIRKGGKVLAVETNKAFQEIPPEYDWCFYIQADEVIHQDDYSAIKEQMHLWKDNPKVEGLLFQYHHFYGSYDYVGDSRKWYRNEVRIIKNDKNIYSFRDAQGFQKNGRPLRVKKSNGYVYHYGWVKPPKQQQAKQESFHKLWHEQAWLDKNIAKQEEFDYQSVDALAKFTKTHPKMMQARIDAKNWNFAYDKTKMKLNFKNSVLYFLDKQFGIRIGEYKNYNLI